MGLFMKGSGKTKKLMLKTDLLEYGDIYTQSKLEITKGKTFAIKNQMPTKTSVKM